MCLAMRVLSPRASLQPTPEQIVEQSMIAQLTFPSPRPHTGLFCVLAIPPSALKRSAVWAASKMPQCQLWCLRPGSGPAPPQPQLKILQQPWLPLCTDEETTGKK